MSKLHLQLATVFGGIVALCASFQIGFFGSLMCSFGAAFFVVLADGICDAVKESKQ